MSTLLRMPRAKGPNSVQLTVNLPSAWIDELDGLAASLVKVGVYLPGETPNRSVLLRWLIRRGLDAAKADAAPPAKKRGK